MENKEGWIKIHRKSMDSSVWKSANIWMVWSWCLMKANHEPHKFPFNGDDMEVLTGQFITGINKAILEIPLTCQMFRSAIKYLEKTQRLTIKTTNKFSLITVNKWQEYQVEKEHANKQITNKQQTSNKPVTTNKNDKNDKNDKNLNTSEETSQTNKDISEVIKMFEIVNPSYEKFYGNKTQRSACQRLLKKWSIPQIRVIVNLLPEFNAKEFQKGKSITPLQMEDNLAYIKTFIDNKRQVNSKITIIS